MNKKALIAMSGGVDSSVAAFLMKEQGYECIGATMKLYQNDDIVINKEHTWLFLRRRGGCPCCGTFNGHGSLRHELQGTFQGTGHGQVRALLRMWHHTESLHRL